MVSWAQIGTSTFGANSVIALRHNSNPSAPEFVSRAEGKLALKQYPDGIGIEQPVLISLATDSKHTDYIKTKYKVNNIHSNYIE